MSSSEEIFSRLAADLAHGLTSEEAAKRLADFGKNELTSKEKDPLWKKYLDQVRQCLGRHLRMLMAGQFKEPLILLLLGSAAVSVIVGQYDDAVSITLVGK